MKHKISINTMALDGKIPTGDARWGRFNDSFQNQELESIDFMNAVYTGHSYGAWYNGRRNYENFICAQHIAVDMESGDERSTLAYLADVEFVRYYGSFIYTTPSHTEQTPRARVVFLLDEPIVTTEAYKTAIGFVYSLFPGSDTSCVDASRFFYGSKNCQLEWLDNVLPVAHLRTYYHRWQKAHPLAHVKRPTQPAQPDGEHNYPTQTPAPNGAPEMDIQTALSKIDPWGVDYKTWTKILASLHEELGDAGLAIAEQWAQGKPGEVAKKWRSFGNYGGHRATIKTIYGMAQGKVY